jgi:hypothetical protein
MSYRTTNIWATLRGMAQGGGTFASSPFKSIFLDPVNGNDANDGLSLTNAKKTLAGAYAIATSGNNDTIYLVGTGASAGTARVDEAFTWAKNATHLVGVTPPNRLGLRARIAPTATTTAFANFFTITGSGCFFQNVQWWHGFNTGVASSIAVTLGGGTTATAANYNRFENCHFAGMGDAASAQDTGSRALLFYTGGENEFVNCTFGIDTIARTVLNALVEFKPIAGGAAHNPRNKFLNCDFLAWTTTAQTQLDVLVSAAGGVDRWALFDRCRFMNSLFSSGYLIQTAIASAPASTGGLLLFKDCTSFGRTGFGKDATTRGFIKIDGAAATANTSGLAIAPTA